MNIYVAELLTEDTYKQVTFFTKREDAELCCAYNNAFENRTDGNQWHVVEFTEDKTDYLKLLKQLQNETFIEEQKEYFSGGVHE